MKIKYILTVIATVAFTNGVFAQYSQDAIIFSNTDNGSTSRVKALGGAGVAVGGDLSSININPAGLGFFTKSEFSFTPEFNSGKTTANYYGTSIKTNKSTGALSNASIVLYTQLATPRGADKTKGWLSLNFGASYSRTSNYNYSANIQGQGDGSGSSIADWYSEMGQNSNYASGNQPTFPDNSLEAFGYFQGLTSKGSLVQDGGGNYYDISPTTAVNPAQQVNILRKGGQSQFDLSMGSNYSNKLYLGFGIGITSISYDYSSVFSEGGLIDDPNNTQNPNPDNGKAYTTNFIASQSTRGTGFNAKFGAIYKPTNAVRLGATITTPTWYQIDDIYSEDVETKIGSGQFQSDGNTYNTRYEIRSPFKASAGIAIFAGSHGFITGDVEYVDYASTNLRSDEYDVTDDNLDIKYRYKSTLNIRAGAEARINSNVFLRGGYSIQGSPQKELQSSVKTVSGGIGYRVGSYYIDATYSQSTGNYFYAPYLLSNNYIANNNVTNPYADVKRQYNNVFVTFGYRF
ncbi:MAG: hypothetical protein ABIN95_00320 [Mucilaginibacter sp.]